MRIVKQITVLSVVILMISASAFAGCPPHEHELELIGCIKECKVTGCTYSESAHDIIKTENCTKICTRCPRTFGTEHSYSEWNADGEEHWKICEDCQREVRGKHTVIGWSWAGPTHHEGACCTCGAMVSKPHGWKYTMVDAKDHWLDCSSCGYFGGTEVHSIKYNSIDSIHHGFVCVKSCGYSGIGEHSLTCSQIPNDDVNHRVSCGICGYTDTRRHSFPSDWTDSGDGEHHYKICSECNYELERSHRYEQPEKWSRHDEKRHKRPCVSCTYIQYETHEGNYGPWLYHNDSKHKKTCKKCALTVAAEHDFPDYWKCLDEVCRGKTCTATAHEKTCMACVKEDGSHYRREEAHDYNETLQALTPEFIETENKVKYYASCKKTNCGSNHKKFFMTDFAPAVFFSDYPEGEVKEVTYVLIKWVGIDKRMKIEKGFRTREMLETPLEELQYILRLYKDGVFQKEIPLPNGGKDITEIQFEVKEYENQEGKLKFSLQVRDNCQDAPNGGLLSDEVFSRDFWIANGVSDEYEGNQPRLFYTQEVFREGIENDGTIPTKKIITLINDKFRDVELRENIDYITENAPNGLKLIATRKSETQAELTLQGAATIHDESANTNTLTIKFQGSAFQGEDVTAVINSVKNDMQVEFRQSRNPKLLYEAGVFEEGTENNGFVPTTKKVMLYNGRFVNEEFVKDTHYRTDNVPNGLELKALRRPDGGVVLKLEGQASPHNETANRNNLTIEFLNRAFVGANASRVINYKNENMEVKFRNPDNQPVLLYEEGPFKETMPANDGSVSNTKVITLKNANFKPVTFIANDHYKVKNIPSGLTFKVERETLNRVKLSFNNKAQNHEENNSVYNFTIEFTDKAFADGITSSDVTGSKNENMQIWFYNTPGDEPELLTQITTIVDGVFDYVGTKSGYGIELEEDVIISSDEELFEGSGYEVYLADVEPLFDDPDYKFTAEYYIVYTNGNYESCNDLNNLLPENEKLTLQKYNDIIEKINRDKHCIKLIYRDEEGREELIPAYGLKLEYQEEDSNTQQGKFKFKLPVNNYSVYGHRKIYFSKDALDGDYSILLIVQGSVNVQVMEGETINTYKKIVRGYKFIEDAINIKGSMYDDDASTVKT